MQWMYFFKPSREQCSGHVPLSERSPDNSLIERLAVQAEVQAEKLL